MNITSYLLRSLKRRQNFMRRFSKVGRLKDQFMIGLGFMGDINWSGKEVSWLSDYVSYITPLTVFGLQ